jgi:hypothetical protein
LVGLNLAHEPALQLRVRRFMKNILVGTLCWLFAAPAWAKPGDGKNLGDQEWAPVRAMTALDGKLYVMSGVTLLAVDGTGKAKNLFPTDGAGWSGPELITDLDGKLYGIAGGHLREIEKDGRHKSLGDSYRYNKGIAGLGGKLYLIDDDYALYVVDKAGKYKKLSEDWGGVKGMTTLGGKLYISKGEHIYEVGTDGTRKALADASWSNLTKLVANGGKLYAVTHDGKTAIHEIDPATGKGTELPSPPGWDAGTGVSAAAVMNDKLYLVQPRLGSGIGLFTVDLK